MVSTLTSPQAAAATAVDILNVSRHFHVNDQLFHALSQVSFRIQQGEFISLIGPSGCGKSTLLRILAGLDSPNSGEVFAAGEKITGPSLSRGMVFQDHRLLPWLTVEQNILLSLKKDPASAAEKAQRVQQLIELVGLAGFAQAWPYQLSGGMSQRAAIARGLAPNPGLLLLDEPFGALDSLTRRHLQKELLRIWQQQQMTAVMVTHDIDEAIYLSDRIIILQPSPGRVARQIEITLPRPRDLNASAFIAIRTEIEQLLGV